MLAPKLPQACRVMCPGEEAGEAGGAPLTCPCLGLLKTSSAAPSQIHQESSEREMVTGAACCTGANLGTKKRNGKWVTEEPSELPASGGFVGT